MQSALDIPPLAGYEQYMVDNLRTAVLLFDDELRLVALNPAAEAMLEVSANQVRGMDVSRIFPDAEEGAGPLARAVQGGYPFVERDMMLQLPGARSIDVDCALTPLREPSQPDGLLIELIPLDRHKRITRERRLVNQSETARLLMRRLAHEIRNPLGGLRGAAQLLEREVSDVSLKEYTNVIIREADRLQNLVARMLGPRTPPNPRAVNIHEVVERVRALVQAESPGGVEVVRDYDPSIPEVHADPELLIQALLNIARNAIEAVNGRGRVAIRTRVHRQCTINDRRHRLVVSIDVCDSGPGVPEDLRETIFYPLFTGRPEGTGLGLSIAQSLVSRQGGVIECSSVPGETVFSIMLPVRDNGVSE